MDNEILKYFIEISSGFSSLLFTTENPFVWNGALSESIINLYIPIKPYIICSPFFIALEADKDFQQEKNNFLQGGELIKWLTEPEWLLLMC